MKEVCDDCAKRGVRRDARGRCPLASGPHADRDRSLDSL